MYIIASVFTTFNNTINIIINMHGTFLYILTDHCNHKHCNIVIISYLIRSCRFVASGLRKISDDCNFYQTKTCVNFELMNLFWRNKFCTIIQFQKSSNIFTTDIDPLLDLDILLNTITRAVN